MNMHRCSGVCKYFVKNRTEGPIRDIYGELSKYVDISGNTEFLTPPLARGCLLLERDLCPAYKSCQHQGVGWVESSVKPNFFAIFFGIGRGCGLFKAVPVRLGNRSPTRF